MTAPGAARILLVSALGFEKADAQRLAIRVRFGELENAAFVGLAGSFDRTKLTRDASEYGQGEWEDEERGPGRKRPGSNASRRVRGRAARDAPRNTGWPGR